MLDHLGLAVNNYEKSKAFYAQALKPLGYKLVEEFQRRAGFGPPGKPLFWIHARRPAHTDLHIAFSASNRSAVDEFFAAATQAGGSGNGPPGLRPRYHANYYGAFVLDPDGNNIEAVCHQPD